MIDFFDNLDEEYQAKYNSPTVIMHKRANV
jgi:hypothetical protein